MLHINDNPLLPSEAFPYLGRTIAYNNSDFLEVLKNLKKAWRRWGVISRVFTKTGATVMARGMMYKAVAHSVLLYGSEIWVFKGAILKVLEEFCHRADRWITGMMEKRVADGEC